MLSNTSKVLERIIYNKIIDHIASQINPVQFKFLWKRPSIQQLLSFLSNVFNDCNQFDVIYLDIDKAFDTVSQPYLLTKLSLFNIGCEIWLWFKAYIMHPWETDTMHQSMATILIYSRWILVFPIQTFNI